MASNMNTPGGSPGEKQGPIPMRHLGELPQDTSAEEHGGVESSDAMGESATPTEQAQRSAANQEASPASATTRQDDRDVSRPSNPVPVQNQDPHPSTAEIVGASGGTDAAAGAKLSGSKGGPGPKDKVEPGNVTGAPGGSLQGDAPADTPGSAPVGGTGLGSTASASDTRTGTGSTSGSGTALTGGGKSGGRDPGVS